MLCENPFRKTGLTTMLHEFVAHGVRLYPDIQWLIFVGPEQEFSIAHERIEICRRFPSNEHLIRRLLADHFFLPAAARKRQADVLLTIGFVPLRRCLPTVMQVFSMQHLDAQNRTGIARRLYRWFVMKYSWAKADLVITNSKFAAQQIVSALPALAARLVQSYEGLQHEQFHPQAGADESEQVRAHFGIGPGYFLWVSNFYPYKQAELLLAGYARLPEAVRRKHPLIMVGGGWDGSLDEYRLRADKLGIGDCVKIIGWIDDKWLAPLYRQARAFCLASREETFGRCVLEAMACGTPCVVNDIPTMREVTDGAAVLVNYRESQHVAAALEKMAGDEAAHQRLRHAGIQRAQRFTFEALARERVTAVANLLATRSHA